MRILPSLHAVKQRGGVFRRRFAAGYGYGPTLASSVVAGLSYRGKKGHWVIVRVHGTV
ncbi:MAG: hypothetical protein NTY42_20175 [Planctomycetota bacterium]|nr:hypothetical protein [Planctomycetota bacterium]